MTKKDDNLLARMDERVKTLVDNQLTIMQNRKEDNKDNKERFEKMEESYKDYFDKLEQANKLRFEKLEAEMAKVQEKTWIQFGMNKAGQATIAGLVAKALASMGFLH